MDRLGSGRERVDAPHADLPLITRRIDAVALGGVTLAVALFLALALTQSGLQQDDPYHLAMAEILNLEFAAPGLAVLVERSGFAIVAGLVGGVYAWRAAPEHREEVLAWAMFAGVACLLALRHHRGVDTFVPVAITFAAVAIGHATPRPSLPRSVLVIASVVFVGAGAAYATRAWTQSRAFEAIDPRACTTWLMRNSAPGDEVCIVDYGAFPRLFHADRENVYTLGLEPAFMRAQDPELFRRYLAAVRLEEDPYPLIADTLGARYIYVENTPLGRRFHAYLTAHASQYRPAYQDDFASVFVVRR